MALSRQTWRAAGSPRQAGEQGDAVANLALGQAGVAEEQAGAAGGGLM